MLAAISVQLGSLPTSCAQCEEEGEGRIRKLRGKRRRLEHFLEGSARREGGRGSRGLQHFMEGSARREGGRRSRGLEDILEGGAGKDRGTGSREVDDILVGNARRKYSDS